MKIYKIAKKSEFTIDNILGRICKVMVKTTPLYGILYNDFKPKSNHACLFIHGTASNFYENEFATSIAIQANQNKIAFLSSNNRGSEGLKVYPTCGACVEIFEDCVNDIDEWIRFLLDQGYNKVSLIGHSLGSEKVAYYMSYGKMVKNVINVVLAGFSDSFGWQMEYAGDNFKELMREAKGLIKDGKGDQFLISDWLSHSGELPASANCFVNFYSDNSALSEALPLRDETLLTLQNINVPVLGTISNRDEYTSVSISEAIKRLKANCSDIVIEQLKGTNHGYEGAEEKVAKIIVNFIREHK